MGLASHDLFQLDHRTQTDIENGRLDLSTIFDYAPRNQVPTRAVAQVVTLKTLQMR